MQDFEHAILDLLDSAFDAGEVDTLMFLPDSGGHSAAVKLIHQPTGIEIVSSDFESQVKNKAVALADLLSRLRKL